MRAAIKLVENQGATVVGKHKTAKIIKAKKCFERFFFIYSLPLSTQNLYIFLRCLFSL